MEFIGKIKSINRDLITDEIDITFSTSSNILPEYEKLKDKKKLRVEAVQYRRKRSLDSNAYMWVLLGKMADVLRADKWDIYLKMLRRYGKYTYVVVRPSVVEAMKKEWRACEVVGDYEINGQEGVQMLCYFGSSTYDNREMSILIDGVISECKDLEIETLPLNEIKKLKEQWGVEIE